MHLSQDGPYLFRVLANQGRVTLKKLPAHATGLTFYFYFCNSKTVIIFKWMPASFISNLLIQKFCKWVD